MNERGGGGRGGRQEVGRGYREGLYGCNRHLVLWQILSCSLEIRLRFMHSLCINFILPH